jgi:hypothetical protein
MAQRLNKHKQALMDEIKADAKKAVAHMIDAYEAEWDASEVYIRGGSGLPTVEGRSKAVKTVLRDTLRNVLPSMMRTLYHSRKPVSYLSTSAAHEEFIEQQAEYAQQLFKASGGYKAFYNACSESMRRKAGPVHTIWRPNPTPSIHVVSGISPTMLGELQEDPEVIVAKITPSKGELSLYDVKYARFSKPGKISVEAFPITEFFIDDEASDISDSNVHGRQRNITVGSAIEMGLDHADWLVLTKDESTPASTNTRRGFVPVTGNKPAGEENILGKKFLLTMVYCKRDINNVGYVEPIVCYFGGTNYEFLTYEAISDYEIDLVTHDIVPFSPIGQSLYDLLSERHNIETALLRSVLDNASQANNPRKAADPNQVEFSDLQSAKIGAPIRARQGAIIQTIDTPFTAAALLPFMQYMEKGTEDSIGVTRASSGLDADAMQSTSKDAVANTILMGQTQIELMVRNVIESGLIGVFQKLLRLSIERMDPMQIVKTKGKVIPVDITAFDPSLIAEPNAGLGTATSELRRAGLHYVLDKQEATIAKFGMDNPFTSLSRVYNTIEDLLETYGLSDAGRYFAVVTTDMEAQIVKGQQEQAQQQQAAAEKTAMMDPAKAVIEVETMKASTAANKLKAEMQGEAAKLRLAAATTAGDLDIKRDKLVQDREIELAKINAGKLNAKIQQEQKTNADSNRGSRSETPES